MRRPRQVLLIRSPAARLLLVAAVAGAALLGPGAARASAVCADESSTVGTTPAPQLRAAVVCLINEERASRGLTPLVENGQLDQAAQIHTDDMIARKYFEHVPPSPPSSTAEQRIEAAGYDWGFTGETLAFGSLTPAGVVVLWLQSPPHCTTILASGFLDAGVGVALGSPEPVATQQSGLWTGVFGRLRSQPPPADNAAGAAGCPFSARGLGTNPGGGGPGMPGTGTGGDGRPAISSLSVSNATFAVNATGAVAQRRPPRGTTFRFTLSEAASVRFSIQRRAGGRRVNGRCVRPTRSNRGRRSCLRDVPVGAFTRMLSAGAARVAFSGRLRVRGRARSLSPARYRATLTATDSGGAQSEVRRVSFRVVRGAR